MQATVASATPVRARVQRLDSVDLLRGLVMVIMALDHVRDFLHSGSQVYSPEDLSQTTGFLFFTRWITHFCAPVFVLLAGVGIYFTTKRRGLGDASRFLIIRGLWLVFIELAIMNLAFAYNFSFSLFLLQVIWAIGWCMVLMAGLIWLPRNGLLAFAAVTILLHNTLDGVTPEAFGAMGWLWNVLHVPKLFQLGHAGVFVAYPLVPWIGVMAAGYCLGSILEKPAETRRPFLFRAGLITTGAFFVLRFLNIYGDPQPWSAQSSLTMSIVSFFRVNKYPPSLDYVLMTLGPALLVLAWWDGARVSDSHPLRVFGRVPMFYYIPHFFLIHALAIVLAQLRYGHSGFMFAFPPAAMGVVPPGFPTDYGYGLGTVYLVWICVVASLYLPCRWYMQVKQRSKSPWLSFL